MLQKLGYAPAAMNQSWLQDFTLFILIAVPVAFVKFVFRLNKEIKIVEIIIIYVQRIN